MITKTRYQHHYIRILLLTATLLVAGCGSSSTSTTDRQDHDSVSQTDVLANPLLTFWKNYDFKDSTLIQDPNKSEQRLVDFIVAFPQYPTAKVKEAITDMLQKATVNPTVFNYFREKYAHYLHDPNSPIRNDLYYEPVLDYLAQADNSTDTDKIRYSMQLEQVRKNQPETKITDFRYLTQNGEIKSLHDNAAKLLIFYDPTCPHCKEIMEQLHSSELLNELIRAKQLHVIAIDPTEDKKRWRDYQDHIPTNWTNGFDDQNSIIKKQMFSLLAYPTLYLIDENNQVILKDPDYQYLLNFLNQHSKH